MSRPFTDFNRQRGVTLLEQIMVVVILAVMSAIAVPSMSRLLLHSQLQMAQTDFIAAMQNARETAVTTGKVALLCPTSDGHRCRSDGQWDKGWLVATDADRDGQPDDRRVLYVGQGYRSKMIIRSGIGRALIRFQPRGGAGGTNATLLLCQPGSNEPTLSVVVANSGRIRGARATRAQAASCINTK